MNIALFQPDIAGNVAAAIRLAACLELTVGVIEPSGFVWDERRLRRVAMDYLDFVSLRRWPSWSDFEAARAMSGQRLVLLTTKAAAPYHQVTFRADDILLGGRESAGVPDEVHARADLAVTVPMAPGTRSLNVVTALSLVVGEALRQTDAFPVACDQAGRRSKGAN